LQAPRFSFLWPPLPPACTVFRHVSLFRVSPRSERRPPVNPISPWFTPALVPSTGDGFQDAPLFSLIPHLRRNFLMTVFISCFEAVSHLVASPLAGTCSLFLVPPPRLCLLHGPFSPPLLMGPGKCPWPRSQGFFQGGFCCVGWWSVRVPIQFGLFFWFLLLVAACAAFFAAFFDNFNHRIRPPLALSEIFPPPARFE